MIHPAPATGGPGPPLVVSESWTPELELDDRSGTAGTGRPLAVGFLASHFGHRRPGGSRGHRGSALPAGRRRLAGALRFRLGDTKPGRGEPEERPGLGVPCSRRDRRNRGRDQLRTVTYLRAGSDDNQQRRGPGLGPAPVRVCPFLPYRGVHRAPPRNRALPDLTGSGDAERSQCLRAGTRARPDRGGVRPRAVHPAPTSGERHIPGSGPDPPVLVEPRAERLSLRDQQPSARPAARPAHHYRGDGCRRPSIGRTAHNRAGPDRNHQRRSDKRRTAATGSAPVGRRGRGHHRRTARQRRARIAGPGRRATAFDDHDRRGGHLAATRPGSVGARLSDRSQW